ncbi:MFS transporter [Actinoplanes sp. SE50]|uniref:MDR family MFS transporter n=1 Tax=unclassified Actinoplanes TaxID=2626549 RepID=UPI00023EBC80|nr:MULTISPECIES: MFS transporter [unclassified Actinoplanes]AEV81232.1 Multidrug resistance protein mdtH [Actinoplanes sp. SE50/110]ATO79635.1 MFS transporter [Actinoplanes sp. SE50]SLL97038.1 MFS transporter [Actinoplanes sp. SE50/110]
MKATITATRSFSRPVQLLLVNQLTINIGFYMLMPYLAGYLSGNLALAGWAVGLVLGVRNLSQQGMFLLGGSLADRLGYKPLILAGLGLRVVGFALLGFVDTLPGLIVASLLTGLAGALFNPAVRAYLAAESGDRKTDAFAVFNVFYQAGILAGPLIGLALLTLDFRWVCLVAAGLFLLLLIAQTRALPARRAVPDHSRQSMLADWRQVFGNGPFLLFCGAMIGSYVLNFQVYLGLPLEVRRITGHETGVAVLFAVSGLLTVAGQVKVTAWAKARWSPQQAIVRGLLVMAAAFVPLTLSAGAGPGRAGVIGVAVALAPVLLSTVLLTIATMIVYPFEMATIVALAGQRLVGTYYGLYNTIAGLGIAAGNLLTGAALDTGRRHGFPALPWLALTGLGAACAAAVWALSRTGRLHAPEPDLDSAAPPMPARNGSR